MGVTTAAIGVLVATALWSATRSSSTVLVGADVALAVAALTLVPVVVRRPEVGGVLAGLLVALSPVATPVASFAVLFTARSRPFRQARRWRRSAWWARPCWRSGGRCPACRTGGGWC
ncbi:hypothetical protein GCM10027614_79860 [Micromonospora vulcania]